jgi:hypothetical protein
MVRNLHMSVQRNKLLWLLMTSYYGKSILRKMWWAQHQVQENILVALTQFWALYP